MRRPRGQTIMEYTIIIGIISLALVAMQKYLQRGVQLSIKVAADELGEQNVGKRERGTFPGVEQVRWSSFTSDTSTSNQMMTLRSFDPNGITDRGNMAVFLARAFNLDTSIYDPNNPSTWAWDFLDADIDYDTPGLQPCVGWAEIQACYAAGIVFGLRGNYYGPYFLTLRRQTASMIFRALDLQPYTGPQIFEDVPVGDRGFEEIGAVYNAGIMLGTGSIMGERFSPDGGITRAEVALTLTRALGLEPYVGPQIFSDVPVTLDNGQPNPAFAAINALYKAGITQGTSYITAGAQRKNINETTTTYGVSQNAWFGGKR